MNRSYPARSGPSSVMAPSSASRARRARVTSVDSSNAEPGLSAIARDRVAETGGGACRAYRFEALREAFGIGLVEPCAHVLGEIGAYRRFPPGSGFGREHGHGQFRVLQRGRAPPVYPGVSSDDFPGAGVGDLHAVPADRGQEPPSVQRRAGEIPVRVDVYLPVLVGPAALPSDRVERGGGQRHQRRAVLPEHVPDGGAPAVMPRRGGQRIASVEHDPSELRVGLGLQRRDHEVAAEEPDRVLHRAFLPTGMDWLQCIRQSDEGRMT